MISRKLSITFLAMLLLTFKAFATTFFPIPLEKLIEESTSATEVELKSSRVFMNPTGLIMTEYTFKVLEPYNLDNSDLSGGDLVLPMAGGTLNGVTAHIEGAPEFQVGEKSFLLLKKIESKMYLSNFTMGKYKIQEYEGQTYYISSVFPSHPDLGRVKKERMIDLVKLKFKITRVPEHDAFKTPLPVVSESKSKMKFETRSPAQVKTEGSAPEDGRVAMWAFFGLFSISAVTIWWKLKQGVSV